MRSANLTLFTSRTPLYTRAMRSPYRGVDLRKHPEELDPEKQRAAEDEEYLRLKEDHGRRNR